MLSFRRHIAPVVSLVFFSDLAGCHRSPLELAPTHGKVTIANKPLTSGKVRFAAIAKGDDVNPGKPAWGKIESDGTFRLTTYRNDDGAVVGDHWVTIINSEEDLPKGVR